MGVRSLELCPSAPAYATTTSDNTIPIFIMQDVIILFSVNIVGSLHVLRDFL